MLSTFPPSNSLIGIHFPDFEPNFSSWENFTDIFSIPESIIDQIPNEPVLSNSGSDNSTPEAEQAEPAQEGILVTDERKRRRMISNRESARRSRMRKQKHLENLRNRSNQLKVVNRELVNRLRLVTHHARVVRNDNKRLRTEFVMLHQRLWALQQVMLVRKVQNQNPAVTWPYNNIMTPINQQILL